MTVRLPLWFMSLMILFILLTGLIVGRYVLFSDVPQEASASTTQKNSDEEKIEDVGKIDPQTRRFDRLDDLDYQGQIEMVRYARVGEQTVQGLMDAMAQKAGSHPDYHFTTHGASLHPVEGEASYRLAVESVIRTGGMSAGAFVQWDIDAYSMTARPANDVAEAVVEADLRALVPAARRRQE